LKASEKKQCVFVSGPDEGGFYPGPKENFLVK